MMNAQLIISGIALGVSMVSVAFVFLQIRLNTNTTKAHLFTTIIDAIHQDAQLQTLLGLLCDHKLATKVDGTSNHIRIYRTDDSTDVTEGIDKLLSRLQVVGHLVFLGVLANRNLQTIHYEIIITGRDMAIRRYLRYLNTSFIEQSGVIHDHFEFFKRLYMKMEYDTGHKKNFADCLFKPVAVVNGYSTARR